MPGGARSDGGGPAGDRSPRRRAPGDSGAWGDRIPGRRRPPGKRRECARDHSRGSGAATGDGERGSGKSRGVLRLRALGRDRRARLRGNPVRILQLMSCRGWSSDAYWAARMTRELERRGHVVTLGCRAGTETRVIDRARREGVQRVTTLVLASGARPVVDGRDLRRLRALMADVDVVHVHRGKEDW